MCAKMLEHVRLSGCEIMVRCKVKVSISTTICKYQRLSHLNHQGSPKQHLPFDTGFQEVMRQ